MSLELKHIKKLHKMCHEELLQLQRAISAFLVDSERKIRLLENHWNDVTKNEISTVATYDNYFNIFDLARNFNAHLSHTNELVTKVDLSQKLEALLPKESERIEQVLNQAKQKPPQSPRKANPTTTAPLPAFPATTTTTSLSHIIKGDNDSIKEVERKDNLINFLTADQPAEAATTETPPSPKLSYAYRRKDITTYKAGSELRAYVTFVYDVDSLSFFVCDANHPDNVLLQVLKQENVLSLRQYTEIPPPGIIFALVDDKHIVRAVRSANDPQSLSVFLLDFGDQMNITSDSVMYRLPDELQNIPAQAMPCQLVDGTNRRRSVEQRKSRLRELEFKSVMFRVDANMGGMLQLQLIEKEDNNASDDEDAQEEPSSTTSTTNMVSSSNTNATNPFLHHYNQKTGDDEPLLPLPPLERNETSLSATNGGLKNGLTAAEMAVLNEEPLGTTNAMKAVMGYDPKDDRRLCRFYDPKTGGCFKGGNCRQDHEPPPPDAWTKDKLPANTALSTANIPMIRFKKGIIVNVTPTYVGRFDRFYAQINNPHDPVEPLIWNPEEVPDWRRLTSLPFVYDMVLARYEDGLWYRATVVETNDLNNTAKVFFVDYGNCQTIPMRELATCDICTAQLPHQAVLCRLAGIRVLADVAAKQRDFGLNFLRSMILNKNLEVRVVCHYDDLFIKFVEKNLVAALSTLVKLLCVEPFDADQL